MPRTTNKTARTNGVSLTAGDRTNIGTTIIRLAHLAVTEHQTQVALSATYDFHHEQANGLATLATDRSARVAARDSSRDTEVSR